jgi:VWFA-related protein
VLPCAVASGLLLVASAPAQVSPPPAYPTQASAITVDVVVLDGHGETLRGLAKEDFTVLEDGKPQTIVGFEARDIATATPAAAVPPEPAAGEGATNVGPGARPGRIFALLIDDLGISAPVASQLKPALEDWIRRRADPRDEVTLMTTSGALWWSDVVETGRDDLLTVLGRLQGKRLARGGGGEMSEAEAYRIAVAEQSTEWLADGASRSRPLDGVAGVGGGTKLVGSSATERVTQRWLDSHVCPPCTDPHAPPLDCLEIRQCLQRVQGLAAEIHADALRREATVLGAIARLSRGLASAPGRKSILLVSEEFLRDTSLGVPFHDAIDAAQRASTSLYFVSAGGLTGASFLGAASSSNPPRPQDVGAIHAEEGVLASSGGESLADETGGTLTRSNDLAAGLERMASDASAYYLLGYQPEKTPDGRWHKLEVKVARRGAEVRARRGYTALRPEDLARSEQAERDGGRAAKDAKGPKGVKAGKRPLAPALLAGSAREGLPLRMAAYVTDTDHAGRARVQVILEIDNGSVRVNRAATPWKASLDLTLLAAGLFHPPVVPVDERLDLTLSPGDVGNGWWLVPREVWLPPGVSQIRALVKDSASGNAGLVTHRIVVPDLDQSYVSTPLVTDRTLPPRRAGEPPRLVPLAHHRFPRRGPLYCEYEVFAFGGQRLAGVPQLWAGYTLERADGEVVSAEEPSPIRTDGDRAVRRIVLPGEKLDAGAYSLVVTIQDRLAGRTIVARAPFQIAQDETLPAVR